MAEDAKGKARASMQGSAWQSQKKMQLVDEETRMAEDAKRSARASVLVSMQGSASTGPRRMHLAEEETSMAENSTGAARASMLWRKARVSMLGKAEKSELRPPVAEEDSGMAEDAKRKARASMKGSAWQSQKRMQLVDEETRMVEDAKRSHSGIMVTKKRDLLPAAVVGEDSGMAARTSSSSSLQGGVITTKKSLLPVANPEEDEPGMAEDAKRKARASMKGSAWQSQKRMQLVDEETRMVEDAKRSHSGIMVTKKRDLLPAAVVGEDSGMAARTSSSSSLQGGVITTKKSLLPVANPEEDEPGMAEDAKRKARASMKGSAWQSQKRMQLVDEETRMVEELKRSPSGIMVTKKRDLLPAAVVGEDSGMATRTSSSSSLQGGVITTKKSLLPVANPEEDELSADSDTTPLLQASEKGTDPSKMSKNDLMACAVAHITDAMAYRDFSSYGDYYMGASGAEETRQRLRAHSFYYEHPAMKVMRAVFAVVFQLLVFFEQPPWCPSAGEFLHNGCANLPKYHMTPITVLPESVTLGVELLCISFLTFEWLVRRKIHGSHFTARGWVRVEGMLLLGNMLGVLARIAILPLPQHRWLEYPLYLRALLRIAHFVLRSRRHRRDVFGVAFAAEQLISVLLSLFATVIVFAWAAFVLFASTYSAAGAPPSISVSLASFLSSLESFFVLLSSATNFPDMMLPAFVAHRALAVFFFIFIVVGSWLGQALVLASVFASFKEGAMTHFDMSTQRRRAAVSRSFIALLGAAQTFEQVPAEVFEEFAGLLHHEFFVKHPQLLRNLTDANHDGEVSAEEFAMISSLLRLEEDHPRVSFSALDPELVVSPYFEKAVTLLLIVNGILVAYESVVLDVISAGHESSALVLADSLMILLFMAELLCRSVALGGLKDYWQASGLLRKADTVVVLVLGAAHFVFVTQCIAVVGCREGSAERAQMGRVSLMLRMSRVLQLCHLSQSLQVLLATAGALLPLVARFVLLLLLLALSFAVVGVALFGGLIHEDAPNLADTPYDPALGAYSYLPVPALPNNFPAAKCAAQINFNDVTAGVVLLLCALTLNPVVQDVVVDSAGSGWARLYFVAWWVCGVCVLLNVLVSFALECFLDQFEHHQQQLARRYSDGSVIEDTAEGAVTRLASGGYLSEENDSEYEATSGEEPEEPTRKRRVYKVKRRVSTFTMHSSARAIMETQRTDSSSDLAALGLRDNPLIARTLSEPGASRGSDPVQPDARTSSEPAGAVPRDALWRRDAL